MGARELGAFGGALPEASGAYGFNPPELRAYQPSWRDRLALALQNVLPEQTVEGLLGTRGLGQSKPRYQTWPERAVTDAIDVAKLPHDVVSDPRFQYKPVTDEASYNWNRAIDAELAKRSTDIAETFATGGVGRVAMSPSATGLGIFGGRLAKTADHAALAKAEIMEQAGSSADDIWRETGWGRGADSQWRFEIPDNEMMARPTDFRLRKSVGADEIAQQKFGKSYADLPIADRDEVIATMKAANARKTNTRLSDAVTHPDVYAAYPDIAAYEARLWNNSDNKSGWFYSPDEGVELKPTDVRLSATARSPEDLRSVTAHEMQHAVQEQEGFARGGNSKDRTLIEPMRAVSELATSQWNKLSSERQEFNRTFMDAHKGQPVTRELLDAEKAAWAAADPVRAKAYESAFNAMTGAPGPFSAYKHLAGEIEARNVQTRLNMTPEERRLQPPWVTEDIPREHQIVRRKPSFYDVGGR